jgi:hypothetical protein
VALPAIGRDLGLGGAQLPWVATAFALPSPGFTLLFGRVSRLAAYVRSADFAALFAVGAQRAWLFLVLVALGAAFFGHVTGIVGYTVTATSGLPAAEQGLATGLTTMTQLVALTIGIPVIGAIAGPVAGAATLGGLDRGLAADVAINALFAAIVWVGLRPPARARATSLHLTAHRR